MAEIKKINTELQLLDKFLDTSGDAGTANQVLVSTATGINWVDGSGSGIIGGPYLPLAGGTLTGDLTISKAATPLFTLLDTTNNISLLLGADDANTFIRSSSTANLYLQPGASTAMTLLAAGNVGIGTTSPSAKLEVNGALFVGNHTGVVTPTDGIWIEAPTGAETQIQMYSLNGSVFQIKNAATSANIGWASGSNKILSFNNSGAGDISVGIGTTSPGAKLDVVGASKFRGTVNVSWFNYSTDEDTYIRGGKSTSKVYINDSHAADVLIANGGGNVGIGTTSPTSKLQVGPGTSNASRSLIASLGGNDNSMLSTLSLVNLKGNDTVGSGAAIDFHLASSYSPTARVAAVAESTSVLAGLAFSTYTSALTEKMRITNAGNVGIGTTSPDSKLHIEDTSGANIILNSATGAVKSGIYLTEGATTAPTQVGAYLSYDGSSNKFSIATGLGVPADKLTIARDTGLLQLNAYGAGTLVSDASGNITVSSGGGLGGPYLPLSAGSGFPLTGALYLENSNTDVVMSGNTSGNFTIDNNTGSIAFQANGSSVNSMTITSSLITINEPTNFTNGNVGIGTTSPGEKFAVKGDASYMEITHPTATSYSGIKFSEGGIPQGSIQNIGSTFATVARRGNFEIFHNAGGNLTLQHSGGNVGIGTTSPGASLHVAGAIASAPTGTGVLMGMDSSYAIVHLNGASGGIIDFSTSGVDRKGRILYNNSSNYMQIQTNGSDKVRIDSTGNVGIGTTSPERKLHVFAGESGGAASNAQSTLVLENSTHTYLQFLTPATSESGILFGDTDNDRGALTYSHSSDAMSFRVAASTKMTILSGGNVGIGTTSPGAKLDIRKDDDTVYDPSADDGQRGIGATIQLNNNSTTTNTFGQIMYDTDSSGQGVARIVFLDAGTASSAIAFVTEQGNSIGERMRIDSSGNVGIGETSPLVPLHISRDTASGENIALILDNNNTTAGNTIGMLFRSAVGSTNTDFEILGVANAANDMDLVFESDGSNERVRFTGDGNVGIGTTNPANKLHIDGTGATPALRIDKGGDRIVYLGTGASSNVGGDDTILQLHNEGVEKVRIFTEGSSWLNGGNVGIGTTSPDYALDIEAVSSGVQFQLGRTGTSVGSTWMGSDSNGFHLGVGTYGTGNSVADPNGFTVLTSGNVGIGTTNPGAKLDVNGATLSTYSNISWEGVNAETYGTLNAKYSANSAVGRGASLAFIGDSGQYSTRIPFTSAVIKSEHESAGNNEKNTSLVFYNHTGGASGTGSLAERMRITSAGNVGIGTTNPVLKFQVNRTDSSNTQAGLSNSGTGAARFYFDASNGDFSGNDYMSIGQANDLIGSIDMAPFAGAFKVNMGNSNAITVLQSGNVGIGTTAPGEKLEVVGNIILTNSDSRLRGGTLAGRLVVSNSDTTSYITLNGSTRAGGANDIAFIANSTSAMLINSSGNVGIGTTNPLAKLDVNGSAVIAGTILSPSMPQHANNTSASNAGLPVGTLYYSISGTDGIVKIVI